MGVYFASVGANNERLCAFRGIHQVPPKETSPVFLFWSSTIRNDPVQPKSFRALTHFFKFVRYDVEPERNVFFRKMPFFASTDDRIYRGPSIARSVFRDWFILPLRPWVHLSLHMHAQDVGWTDPIIPNSYSELSRNGVAGKVAVHHLYPLNNQKWPIYMETGIGGPRTSRRSLCGILGCVGSPTGFDQSFICSLRLLFNRYPLPPCETRIKKSDDQKSELDQHRWRIPGFVLGLFLFGASFLLGVESAQRVEQRRLRGLKIPDRDSWLWLSRLGDLGLLGGLFLTLIRPRLS